MTSSLLLENNLRFHHIGVACKSIEAEVASFSSLGYKATSDVFHDENQGIRGLFIEHPAQPRLELLENLPESKTLNPFLEKGIKFYHFGYITDNIEQTKENFNAHRWATLSPIKPATYFKCVCFLLDRNGFIIELIEER